MFFLFAFFAVKRKIDDVLSQSIERLPNERLLNTRECWCSAAQRTAKAQPSATIEIAI
jgi:hypothetical protein